MLFGTNDGAKLAQHHAQFVAHQGEVDFETLFFVHIAAFGAVIAQVKPKSMDVTVYEVAREVPLPR